MDSNFMNNLSDMMKNGNIPDDIKNLMNNFKNNNQNSKFNNMNQSENSNNEMNSETFNDFNKSNSSSSNNLNPDFLKNVMGMLGNANNSGNNVNNNENNSNSNSDFGNIDINMIFKIKSIMDKMNSNKNDPRSNLLLSLKPYLKESRKGKLEQYVQLLNMSKVMEAFNQNGGENAK